MVDNTTDNVELKLDDTERIRQIVPLRVAPTGNLQEDGIVGPLYEISGQSIPIAYNSIKYLL